MAMPIAGRLTDQLGAGRIVPFGVVVAVLGTARLHAARRPTPSYGVLGVALWVRGHRAGHDDDAGDGRGLPDARARGGAARHVDDQHHPHVGGSFGTAVLTVVLRAPDRRQRPGRDRRARAR